MLNCARYLFSFHPLHKILCFGACTKMQVLTRMMCGLLALLVSFFAYADFSWNFPTPVTPMAVDTLQVHNKFMLISIVIFFVVLAIMVYSLFAHRKSKGFKPVADKPPSTALEIFWTLVPFVILFVIDFVIMGIPAYHSVVIMENTRQQSDMVVKITGSQWRWQYEYLDGGAEGIKFVSNLTTSKKQMENQEPKGVNYLLEVDNPLVLPVGKKVRILMTASDVLHNWWVPQFGSSRLAVPGFIRETWVKIEAPGTYRGQCKELCGIGHGFMPVVVEAKPLEDYQAWVETKKREMTEQNVNAGKAWSKEELLSQGKIVYEKNCAVCHQVTGAGLPPAFPALTGSKITTTPIFSADGKYMKDSHLDRVLNGKNAMPAWKNTLNDTEIASVITYERNALGNSVGDILQPEQVKAARQ